MLMGSGRKFEHSEASSNTVWNHEGTRNFIHSHKKMQEGENIAS